MTGIWETIVNLEDENALLKELNLNLKFALQEAVEIDPSLLACGMIADALAKAEGAG